MKRRKILQTAVALLCLLALLLSGCASSGETAQFTELRQLDGQKIGILTGSTFDQYADGRLKDIQKEYYNTYPDMVLALRQGKIAAFLMDEPMARMLCEEEEGITYLEEYLAEDSYAFAFPKTDASLPLREQMNEFLQTLREDGTLAEIEEIWFGTDEGRKTVADWTQLPDENGTLHFAAKTDSAPFAYLKDNQTVGYDVDIMIRFCQAYGYGLEIHNVESSTAFIAGLESSRYDVAAAGFSVTEEREESMYFSEPNYAGGVVAVVTGERGSQARFESLEDFSGATVGQITGTVLDQLMSQMVSNVHYEYYDDFSSQLLALQTGGLDAVLTDEPMALLAVARQPDLAIFPEMLAEDSYGLGLQKGSPLTQQVNALIEGYAADGTLAALQEKWFGADEDVKTIDIGEYDAPNGTLRYVHDSSLEPMSYVGGNGQSLGYEVELVSLIARDLGMELEVTQGTFNALMPMLASGRADIISGSISITEERRESIDLATAHYTGGTVLLVRAEDLGLAVETEQPGFWQSIAESFEKNFIQENRWQLILSGLGVTCVISVCAALIGTALGFGLCMVRRSRSRIASKLAAAFIRLIQGIPVLVLLMVFFYVVFAGTRVDGILVAIVGFSINFAVYVSEMIRTGIDAVDAGQWEAAQAIGFSRAKTFLKIILPQAARHILPVYKGELISMVKMTSIVGYIAVQDLTKVTDIIRSRTFEAFFPLIVTALIYFLLAWGLASLLGILERKIDPKRRRREPKGIFSPAADGGKTGGHLAAKRAGETVLAISHLKKEFPNATPLRDVNAEIHRGEVISIIGPSGTGKSTLLRCLNRLEMPTGGQIYAFGKELTQAREGELSAVRRRMGMVFQGFNLFPHMTVIENIMLGPEELLKCPRPEAYARGMELLRSVGLAEKALSYPDELSGGQKQRAAIARTLAMEPEVVLFDEPTSALDPTMVGEVLSVIRNLAGRGLTMLIVTHEMRFARDVSSRIFYLDEGVIYEEGTPEQVFEAPRTAKCRAFVQRLKTLHLEIEAKEFDFIGAASQIDAFARKQLLSAAQSLKYQQIFEELCVAVILPTLAEDGGWQLTFDAACREDGSECEAVIGWAGEAWNPLTEGDDLSVTLALARTKSSEHRYDGGKNIVTIVF